MVSLDDDERPVERLRLEGYTFGDLLQRLAARCYERQAIMRCVLRSIEDGSILEKATTSIDEKSELALIRLDVDDPPPTMISVSRAVIEDTFIGIVRAFFDYVDGLHGALRWARQPFRIDQPFATHADLNALVVEKLDAVIYEIAADTKMSNGKKIAELGLHPNSQRICDGLREVRRTLEHHKGVAQQDIQFTVCVLGPVYLDGKRYTERGFVLDKSGPAREVEFHATWELQTHSYAAGTRIDLEEIQVERTIGTILNVLMPELREALYRTRQAMDDSTTDSAG